MATTLRALRLALFGTDGSQGVLQDAAYYPGVIDRINDAVTAIAGGLRMPDGQRTSPLPDLYKSDTVITSTSGPSVPLPSDYQRDVFMIVDSNGRQLYPPNGGGYYDFALFLRQASQKDLTQAGSISRVCIKGRNLYYQGIPATSKPLTLHYYRTPTDMGVDADTVDGLPDYLAKKLIKHYVAAEVYGEIEDGDNSRGTGFKHHTSKLYETLMDLMDYAGIDEVPAYYGASSYPDLGVCD